MSVRSKIQLRQFERFTGRSAGGLVGMILAGTVFGALLLLVRSNWSPLESVDHGVADDLNEAVSRHPFLVNLLKTIATLGSTWFLWIVVTVAVVGLLIRKQHRLAAYLVVTGLGAACLGPALKVLVDRLRPVVENPVAHAPGKSFPSGHSLGSMIVYGALLMVFLPGVRRGWRRVLFLTILPLIILAIGFTRIGLGVHYLSDVIGGWMLGIAWLGVTTFAFQMWRREQGRREVPPTEGLDPESAEELRATPEDCEPALPNPRWAWAELLVGWVIMLGVLYGMGIVVTPNGNRPTQFDRSISSWFAEHRTPFLNDFSHYVSRAGDTPFAILFGSIIGILVLAALRTWRPVLFLVIAMLGEATLFVSTAAIIKRPRPEVSHLDPAPHTASFPSGHVAAAICLYVATALVIYWNTRSRWRWLGIALCLTMPLSIALARLYRGMHHPTDILGSIVLVAGWLSIVWWVVRPTGHPKEEQEGSGADKENDEARRTGRLSSSSV